MQSEFRVLGYTETHVFLVDLDTGLRSVTNDAERVVRAIAARFGARHIIYRDTMDRWDELAHEMGNFRGFLPYAGPTPDGDLNGTHIPTFRPLALRLQPINPPGSDVYTIDAGSLIGLRPATEAAHDWFAANLPDDAPRLGVIVYVEARFAGPILEGMADSGLVVDHEGPGGLA